MKIGGEHGVSRVLSQQQERFDKLKNTRLTSTQCLFDDVIADTSHDGEETSNASLQMEVGLEKVTNASIKGVVRLSKRYFENKTKFCQLHDFNGTVELNTPCVASSIATNVKICFFPTSVDVFVSGSISRSGSFINMPRF